MPCKSEQSASNLKTSLPWLHDATRYEDGMPRRDARGCPRAKMPHDFVLQLEKHGVVRPIRRCEVRGHVAMFTVTEYFKKRFRPIKHTREINDVFGKESLRKCKLVSKDQICHLVNKGSHFAQFDFMAWFDQLKYGPGVGEFCCFRSEGKFYCLDRLAMGQRQAVEVAQAVTEYLLDFPERRCVAHAVIDNVIFVGSFDDVRHDAEIFVERCDKVHALINDIEGVKEKGIESCIRQAGEWCGVDVDMVGKCVKLTAKTASKFHLSWGNRSMWTWRQFAAHIGLLFWTWGILDVPVHNYYPLLRFISGASRRLQEDESLWDDKAIIDPAAMPVIAAWTALAFANEPRVVKESSAPSWFVCTDASKVGWGYVALNVATGEIRAHGQQWTRAQLKEIFSRNGIHKIKKSVYSEPLAVYFALCHLLKSDEPKQLQFAKEISENLRTKIHVATDNSSACHTINRGFATRSFDINKQIQNLRTAFPASEFDIDLTFIPGWMNPADDLSRGRGDSSVYADIGKNVNNFQRTWEGVKFTERNFTRAPRVWPNK